MASSMSIGAGVELAPLMTTTEELLPETPEGLGENTTLTSGSVESIISNPLVFVGSLDAGPSLKIDLIDGGEEGGVLRC